MRILEIPEDSMEHTTAFMHKSYRDFIKEEAYECGYEDGYRKAMKEAQEHYNEQKVLR